MMACTLAMLLHVAAIPSGQSQKPDVVGEFERWSQTFSTPALPEVRLEQYREKLRVEGVSASEIERRLALIETAQRETG